MPQTIEIRTSDDGAYDGYLCLPPRTPAPGVVMIPEIFGVNPSLCQVARQFAARGYCVLAPDIFWRLERNVALGYDEESYRKAFALHAAFDYQTGVHDMEAAVETLRARPECSGGVAVTGFCLGGTMAYLAAARCPVDAAIGYYGTRIQNFLADGPRIACPTILHFGGRDHTTPPEIMARILPAVRDNPNVAVHIYDEAGHAFANPARADTFMPEIAARAHERTYALLRAASADAPAG